MRTISSKIIVSTREGEVLLSYAGFDWNLVHVDQSPLDGVLQGVASEQTMGIAYLMPKPWQMVAMPTVQRMTLKQCRAPRAATYREVKPEERLARRTPLLRDQLKRVLQVSGESWTTF